MFWETSRCYRSFKTSTKINDEWTKRRKRSQSASGTKQHELIRKFLGYVRSKCPHYNDPPNELREEFNSWQTTRRTFPAPFSSALGAGVFPLVSSFFSFTGGRGRLAFKDWNDKRADSESKWITLLRLFYSVQFMALDLQSRTLRIRMSFCLFVFLSLFSIVILIYHYVRTIESRILPMI